MFQDRGISDLQPSPASEVTLVIENIKPSPSVITVLSHLMLFAICQVTTTARVASEQFYNIFRSVAVQYWIQTPTAIFSFPHVTDEMEARLKSYGLQVDTGRKNSFSGSPSFDHLKEIFKMSPSEGRFTPGYASIQAYTSWMYLQKAMSVYSFLSHAGNNLQSPVISASYDQKSVQKVMQQIEVPYLGTKGSIKLDGWGPDLNGIATSSMQVVGAPHDKSKSFTRPALTSSSTIETEGIYFPFFEGMNLPDKEGLSHVFSRTFVRMLGSSRDVAYGLWSTIRPGLRALATLRAGVSLSHAFVGIELSMDAQCPISFVVEHGLYHGFILHGELRVMKNGFLFYSVGPELLTGFLRSISQQDALRKELAALVNTPTASDGSQLYSVSPNALVRSRAVYTMYQTLNPAEFDEANYQRVKEIIEMLTFTDSFSQVSQASIIDFLTFMATGDLGVIDKYPAYLSSGYYRLTGRIYQGLSIFGSRAPSLNYDNNGLTFVVPSEDTQIDPNLAPQADGKRLLHYLPFKMVPVVEGASQWKRLFEQGKFGITRGRKGKSEFTDTRPIGIKIATDPGFTQAYTRIKDVVNSHRQLRKAGKRRAMDDEEVETSTRKKARNNAGKFFDEM